MNKKVDLQSRSVDHLSLHRLKQTVQKKKCFRVGNIFFIN